MADTTMMNDRYLIHYGVKGMKWGIRHDPERIGQKRSLNLSNKQKKILKKVAIGAAITGGVILASYGALKVNDIHNYRKISKAAKSAVQDVLRKRNREAISGAKQEFSHRIYNDDRKERIINSYKERVIENRKRSVEEEKELIADGYKTFKKLRTAKVKDIISPSPFGRKADLYDPYDGIDFYRKLNGI